MSEVLDVFTVPGEWYDKSVDVEPFNKIVGVRNLEGEEVFLPDSPKSYWYGGGYREGYSRGDVEERALSLSAPANRRLVHFLRSIS